MCINLVLNAQKARGDGGESNTNTEHWVIRMQNYDLRGLWSLTSSTLTRMRMRMRMEQHVYLVGSRNYSNFNNLSAARLPNKYISILIGRCWANEGTPVAVIIIYLFTNSVFYVVSSTFSANNILNSSRRSCSDIESPFCIPMIE